MESIFLEISLILIVAALCATVAKGLRQPIIPAYILAGVLLGPSVFNVIKSGELLHTLSTFGIAFLLFLVGIELDLRNFLKVGKVAIVAGVIQMGFAATFGYIIIRLLGYHNIEAWLLAIALGFSSTIIGLKLIGERKELDTLYGQIVIGILLTQDFIAVFILLFFDVFTSGLTLNSETIWIVGNILLKAILLFSLALLSAKFILRHVFAYFAHSVELLFLGAICWCLLFSLLAMSLGFSIEVGALLAGVSLSFVPYSHEISYRIKSLRDFFLPIFFAVLGGELVFNGGLNFFIPAIILSAVVLFVSPVIITGFMLALGYRARTSFQAGIAIGQVSEFSFILMGLAFTTGLIDHKLVALVALIGLITMTVSTYMFEYNEQLYTPFKKLLKRFERNTKDDELDRLTHTLTNHIILFGYDAMGYSIHETLQSSKRSIVVIDHNPRTVKKLQNLHIQNMYGSMSDDEILETLNINAAATIISTIRSVPDTIELLEYVQHHHIKAKVLVTAFSIDTALRYYELGAHYVIIPPIVSAAYLPEMMKYTATARKHHVAELKHLQTTHTHL